MRTPSRARLVAVFGTALLLAGSAWSASFPAALGTGGAVASSEQASTEAGLEILRQGGNAVDAAVANLFAYSEIEP